MIKRFDDNPKVNDRVEFILLTPDANDCFTENPYAFVDITIYYIQRDFANININEYEEITSQKGLEVRYYELNNIACENPTQENLKNASDAKQTFLSSQVKTNFYYLNSQVVFQQGSASNPLWLKDGSVEFPIVKPEADSKFTYSRFVFYWDAFNVREGDYFICWKWKPNVSGDTISAHIKFYLDSDIATTTSNPTHRTPRDKYYDLLTRYLPEMYKQRYSAVDLSPEILDKLNVSIGQGFTVLENLANQIIDLYDANIIQEQLLVYLASMFNLTLRSTDPTRWRKQIKKAIPLYKRKGTFEGLRQALDDAGIRILSFSQLWFVGTDYTYTESFPYTGNTIWELDKVSLPVNEEYFKLEFEDNSKSYYEINLSNVEIVTGGGQSFLKWKGKELTAGDRIKITYQIKEFKSETQIQIHNYIIRLPLADTRDDRTFEFPKKDWNTRVIEESDSLFDSIVSVKNPFYDPVKFGKIRTEFPYSEQAYNMDEYNGSLRDSYDPKDIDKNFVEPCRNTISSHFNIDLLIQDLSNTRLVESQEIIEQYIPFHAVLHTLRFNGYFDDIVVPPIETIQCLIQYAGNENIISGEANSVFNRNMPLGLYSNKVLRNVLATESLEDSGTTTAYNEEIRLFSPLYNLDDVGLDTDSPETFLEVLAPHVNAGEYTLSDANGHTAKIASGSPLELINTSDFTFRLSNIIFSSANFDIYQDNIYQLSDQTYHFVMYPIKTLWDVQNGYAASSWKIYIDSNSTYYNILNVSDNIIFIENDGSLYNVNIFNFDYKIVDQNNNIILSSSSGNYFVTKRARVEISPSVGINDITRFMTQQNYFYYDANFTQYLISGYSTDNTQNFYILDWNLGDVTSASGKFLKRLIDSTTGNFNYSQMKLLKPIGWPTFTSVGDPNALENSNFIENYLVEYAGTKFSILKEETVGPNTYVYITGKFYSFGTQTYGGTSVSYSLHRYTKDAATIMGEDFNFIDRSGQELITSQVENMSMGIVNMLASKPENEEFSQQLEGIQYTILRRDGTETKGDL